MHVLAAVAALYLPEAQTTQSAAASWAEATAPLSSMYVPATHDAQLPAPAELYFPASQTRQSIDES